MLWFGYTEYSNSLILLVIYLHCLSHAGEPSTHLYSRTSTQPVRSFLCNQPFNMFFLSIPSVPCPSLCVPKLMNLKNITSYLIIYTYHFPDYIHAYMHTHTHTHLNHGICECVNFLTCREIIIKLKLDPAIATENMLSTTVRLTLTKHSKINNSLVIIHSLSHLWIKHVTWCSLV